MKLDATSSRGPVAQVDGRPALELRDEDREPIVELRAQVLIDALASSPAAAR